MRSLSEIKKRKQVKEEDETLTVDEVLGGKMPEPLKPVTSKKQPKSVKKITEAARVEINQLNEEIKAKRKKAEVSGEGVVEAAKEEAKNIISKATEDRADASNIKSRAISLREKLKKTASKQKERETYLGNRETGISVQEKGLEERDRQVSHKEKLTQKSLEEATDLLVGLTGVLLVGIDKVENIAELENVTGDEVKKVLFQAEKLYNEVGKKKQLLKAEQSTLDRRKKILNTGEEALKDARRTLQNAQREVNINHD